MGCSLKVPVVWTCAVVLWVRLEQFDKSYCPLLSKPVEFPRA